MENLHQNNYPPMQQITCRICLDWEPKGDILSPCQCKGSTKYVHQKCLLQWATKNQKIKQSQTFQQYQLQCEICKHKMPISCVTSTSVRNCQKIKEVIQGQKIRFIIQSSAIVILIICWAYIINKYMEYRQDGIVLFMYISLSIMILLGLVTLAIISSFIYDYAVEVDRKYSISKIEGQGTENIETLEHESAFQMANANKV